MRAQPQTAEFSALLLHPWPLLSALLILFNAFYLRQQHPGFWSGKLSDVGICFLLPVLLAASWAWVVSTFCPQRGLAPPGPVAFCSCLVAAGYFSALNLLPGFPRFHERLMGFLVPHPIRPTMDVTDLLCLVFTVGAYFFIRRRLSAPHAPRGV